MKKEQFLKLLRTKRELLTYVVIDSDFGMYVKQSKSTWIEIVKSSNVDEWNVVDYNDYLMIG